jgi:hypothetical protein
MSEVTIILLSREEKEKRRGEFSVEEIGELGEAALLWVTRTMRGAYLSVVADRLLIKNSHGVFPELSTENRELYRDYLHLDAMAKTMMIIETFVTLCYTLAFRRKCLAKSLARTPSMMGQVLPALDIHILGRKRNETIRRILSLPSVGSVGDLSKRERNLLSKLSDESAQKLADDYAIARDFYECHRTAYDKLRHGMSVILGMKSNVGRANFAIDLKKKEKRKPPNVVEIQGSSPLGNAMAIIPADDRTLGVYEKLALETDLYVRYITGSLFARICNSGEGYLPCVMKSENEWVISYIPKTNMPPDEKKEFDHICEKIQPNFVMPSLKAHVEFRFGPKYLPQIEAQLQKYHSAEVWYSGVGSESSYEYGWRSQ